MKLTERLIQNSEDIKQLNFFTVHAQQPYSPQSSEQRKKAWDNLFKVMDLPLDKSWIEGESEKKTKVVLEFSNGLRIEDAGQQVSFLASTKESKIDPENSFAKWIIECAANHLCRQGFGVERVGSQYKPIISNNFRSGASKLMLTFESAYARARKIINDEEIARLKSRKVRQ